MGSGAKPDHGDCRLDQGPVCPVMRGMPTLLYLAEFVAVLAFAVSGIAQARAKRLDPMGTIALAFVTAFGGGTIRDLCLNRHPLYWIVHQEMAVAVVILAVVMSYARVSGLAVSRTLLIADGLGLALFSVLGTAIGLDAGLSGVLACMIGLCSATAGGVLRDQLVREIPMIFQRIPLYATCSLIGCVSYLPLHDLASNRPAVLLVPVAIAGALRLLAVRFDWRLPDNNARPAL